MRDSDDYSAPSPTTGQRHGSKSPIRGSSGQETPRTPGSSRTYHIRRPAEASKALLKPIPQSPSSGTKLPSMGQPEAIGIASGWPRHPMHQSFVNPLEAGHGRLPELSDQSLEERFPFLKNLWDPFAAERPSSRSITPGTMRGLLESGSVGESRSGVGSHYGQRDQFRMQQLPTETIHTRPVFGSTAIIYPPEAAPQYPGPPPRITLSQLFPSHLSTMVNRDETIKPSRHKWSPANQTTLLGHSAHNSIGSVESSQTTSSKTSVSNTTAQNANTASLATTPENMAVGPVKSGFVPMGRVQGERALGQLDPEYQRLIDQQKELAGISKGYGGDPFNPANQSADVPEEENTALWITNLPPDCDHRALLNAVRGCGKVFACVVNPPTAGSGRTQQQQQHMTAAAKLVFFDVPGAVSLLTQSHRGEFKVGGFVPRVRKNRIRSAAREPGPHCRVLHIEGPAAIVNTPHLLRFFGERFSFEIENITTLNVADASQPGLRRVRQEWRFGSFRCQAEAARQSIHREKERIDLSESEKAMWDQVNVHFGVDPCAP